MKLPFYAFSSLPGFDCPLALVCTVKTNTRRIISARAGVIRSRAGVIRRRFFVNCKIVCFYGPALDAQSLQSEFANIPAGRTVRLYVDGDFVNLAILRFWMEANLQMISQGHNGIAGIWLQ